MADPKIELAEWPVCVDDERARRASSSFETIRDNDMHKDVTFRLSAVLMPTACE